MSSSRNPVLCTAAAFLASFAVTACEGDNPTPSTVPPTFAPIPPQISPYEPVIDPDDFAEPVANPYYPLEPGTTYVYKGGSGDESETVTIDVTHHTKVILGVTTTVVRDVARVDGEVAERTFDWFATDRYGNVWYFGEATKEYDGKRVSAAGSWEAGVDGALPGIVMLADPEIGERYRQEYYAGEAEDMGKVLELDASVTVPFGSFTNMLVTEDSTPLEPRLLEHKYYARGIGVVFEEAVRGGGGQLELVELTRS